jgi:UDP-glucuronate decarboxylase
LRRVLVTGGAGFLGSHLCESLLNEGCDVVCLDNFSTGSKQAIARFLNNPYFELITHDITEHFMGKVDEIYHLASPASPIHYQRRPVETVKTNVVGSINTLEIARETGAKILFSSTSEVYGDPLEHPQREDYWGNVNPIGPRSCYDEGKRCAETLFFDYRRQYDVRIRVARIFNTYGPFMKVDDGRVISNFIVQALKQEPLTVYGDGTQTRSFCYVSDMIKALILLMNMDDSFTGPVNLGDPCEKTVGEIAETIIRLTRSSSRIIFHPLPENDPRRRLPDITLATEALKWKPKVPLSEGLEETIRHFREILEG